MEPFHIEKNDVELGVYIGEDGVIYLRMKGNLTSDHLPELKAWDAKVREAMRTAAQSDSARVLCLTDLTNGLEADEVSLQILKDLIQHNKEYATRTAVIGANFFMRNILILALRATHRSNMESFNTREDAMEWLLQGDSSDVEHAEL
jgi:hypothetical protein